MDTVDCLDDGRGEGHCCLHQVCDYQPDSALGTNDVGNLAGGDGSSDEQCKAYPYIGETEQVAVRPSEADGKNDRVSCLIGRKAMEIWKTDRVLNPSAECEKEKLSLDEPIDP